MLNTIIKKNEKFHKTIILNHIAFFIEYIIYYIKITIGIKLPSISLNIYVLTTNVLF